jgi:uncharacterized DUF497 family protein
MNADISYIFDPQKNAILKANRGVGFEDVIYCINNGKILNILKHHNTKKYPDQWIAVVEIDNYAYQVPFKYEGQYIRLITVFPSRKFTQIYIGDN